MRRFALMLLAVVMLAPHAYATQLYMPFNCAVQAHVTVGSAFHASYEVDWNIGSGDDDAYTRIVASAPGRVIFAGNSGCGLGYKVVIDHGDGSTTTYAHLQPELNTTVGDMVMAGYNIGYVGKTGWCSGFGSPWPTHLHEEYRVNGVLQPPYYVEANGYIYGKDPSLDGKNYTSMNCEYNGPPPQGKQFGYSRAFPTGAGTLNPYAWERGRLDFGGSDIGVAVESPRWESGYVVQRHRRVTDAVDSFMVHNQDHGAARAFPIIDAFYKAFLQFGGLPRLGAPISKKYQTSPTSWRQDFQYSYIVINDGQAAINYAYPSGYTPGQGSSEKQMFETAYGDLSGTNNIGNPSTGVNVSGGLEWQTYTMPTGATSKLVAIPSGYFRAFQIKSGIEKVLNANGGVAVFGPPISDEFDIGNNQTRQYFRFGTFTHNSVTYATTFVKTARQYAPGETVSPVTSALYLRDAFERNGSYAKLGICTAPYYGAGHVYQYCSGGSSSGRAAVILNPSAGNYVAFVVRAGIEGYYESVGGITGVMGTPVSDEWIPNGGYTFQDFGHKTMQWYNYGPHVADYVYQVAIGEGSGFPTAFHFMWNLDAVHLGQPLNAAHWWHNRSGTSVLQDYEGGTYTGTVTFVHNEPDRAPRAFELRGGVRTTYFNMGGPDSYLGRPISDEVSSGTKTRQYFEGGYIGGDTSAAVYTATRY